MAFERAPFIVVALVICGCSVSPKMDGVSHIAPEVAIMSAARMAPEGVAGIFQFEVSGWGQDREWLFLNSEEDYRDQRSLNVAIDHSVASLLGEGSGDYTSLLGKTIRVTGEAKRTKISFLCGGKKTGKYYYQTQVRVTDAGQFEIVPNEF